MNEGRISKGGQNPPDPGKRPPAPQGSEIPPHEYNPDYNVHPGATLREVFIHRVIGDTLVFNEENDEVVHLLDELMQGRGEITEALAEVLEEATKISKNFWINLQKGYDERKDQGWKCPDCGWSPEDEKS